MRAAIFFFAPRSVSDPDSRMYKSILPLRFTARTGTRLLLPDLALSHRLVDGATYWLFSLQHTVIMEKKCGKVCVCEGVCGTRVCGFYWGKAMEHRIEWFGMLDGREERAGVFCSNAL